MMLVILFWTFFKIGLFTFGGGYAMFALVQAEVLKHHWMQPEELINFIAISESTPGSIGINISTYVGQIMADVPGAIIATFGNILPSFLIILLIAKNYKSFQNSNITQGFMIGLKPAVVGMIGSATVFIAQTIFFPHPINDNNFSFEGYLSIGIFLIMLIATFYRIPPILIICLSMIAGIIVGYAFAL